MTNASRGQVGRLWSISLAAVVFVACGQLTNSPQERPDNNPAGEATTPRAGTTQTGGATNGSGGANNASGGAILILPTAGTTSSNTPDDPGTAGEGGQPSYPAVANLCMYPDDIPENWGAGGATDVDARGCVVPLPGGFNYMGCRYELLGTAAFDVDPFVGGHSHCCYAAKLLACR